jgi:hypothetical protein
MGGANTDTARSLAGVFVAVQGLASTHWGTKFEFVTVKCLNIHLFCVRSRKY